MTDLGPYPGEVRYIADELKEYLVDGVKQSAFDVLKSIGETGLLKMSEVEREKALKLLSQTPSQRDKALRKLDDRSAATLILRARYLGLASAKVLEFSELSSNIRGKGYRSAAEYGAREFLRSELTPSLSELLPGWGYDDGLDDEMDGETADWQTDQVSRPRY